MSHARNPLPSVHIKKTLSDSSSIEIIGSDGDSSIVLGEVATAFDNEIYPNIIIDAGSGFDSLTIHDSASTILKSVEIRPTLMNGLHVDTTRSISYFGIEDIDLELGTTSANLTVYSTAKNTSLKLSSQDGDDVMTFVNAQGSLNIASGDGDKTISMLTTNGDVSIVAGDGEHSIDMTDTNGTVSLDLGGLGSNSISATNTEGSFTLTAGSGSNTVDVSHTVAAVSITTTELATETVSITVLNTTEGGVTLDLGAGSHFIDVQQTVSGDVDILTEGGAENNVTVIDTNNGDVSLSCGDGPHFVDIEQTSGSVVVVLSDGGDDVVYVRNAGGTLDITTGE